MKFLQNYFQFRLAKKKEIHIIMKFIKLYWRKNHLLGINKKFFEYEYLLGDKLNFMIAFHKKNKGALSYTQYRRINKSGRLGRIIKSPNQISYEALLKSNVIANSTALIDRQNIPIEDLLMNNKLSYDDYPRWLNITRNYGPAAGLGDSLMLYFYSPQTDSGNKLKSIYKTWEVYRVSQKLSPIKSLYYLIHYILNGLIKHSKF